MCNEYTQSRACVQRAKVSWFARTPGVIPHMCARLTPSYSLTLSLSRYSPNTRGWRLVVFVCAFMMKSQKVCEHSNNTYSSVLSVYIFKYYMMLQQNREVFWFEKINKLNIISSLGQPYNFETLMFTPKMPNVHTHTHRYRNQQANIDHVNIITVHRLNPNDFLSFKP